MQNSMVKLALTFESNSDQIQIQKHISLEDALQCTSILIQNDAKYEIFSTSNKQKSVAFNKSTKIYQLLQSLNLNNQDYVCLTISQKSQKVKVSVTYQNQNTEFQINQNQKCLQITRIAKKKLKLPRLQKNKKIALRLLLKNKNFINVQDYKNFKSLIQTNKRLLLQNKINFLLQIIDKSLLQSQINSQIQKMSSSQKIQQTENLMKSQIIKILNPVLNQRQLITNQQKAQNNQNLRNQQNFSKIKKHDDEINSKFKKLNSEQDNEGRQMSVQQQKLTQYKQPTNQQVPNFLKPYSFQITLQAQGYQKRVKTQVLNSHNANRKTLQQLIDATMKEMVVTYGIQWQEDDPYEIFYLQKRFLQRKSIISAIFDNKNLIKIKELEEWFLAIYYWQSIKLSTNMRQLYMQLKQI